MRGQQLPHRTGENQNTFCLMESRTRPFIHWRRHFSSAAGFSRAHIPVSLTAWTFRCYVPKQFWIRTAHTFETFFKHLLHPPGVVSRPKLVLVAKQCFTFPSIRIAEKNTVFMEDKRYIRWHLSPWKKWIVCKETAHTKRTATISSSLSQN